MPRYIPQTPCPNCHKKIWQLTTKAGLTFCPHCHINLYPVKQTTKKQKKPISKTLAFFISFCFASFLYISNIFRDALHDNPLFQIGIKVLSALIILMIVWMVVKEIVNAFRQSESKYEIGVDTLEQITADSCDYTQRHNSITPCQCKNCPSFRLVDMYWFKRILAKNHEEIPVMANIGDTDRFVGCLHCKTQYKRIQTTDERKEKLIGYLLFFLLTFWLANLFFPQTMENIFPFIPEKSALFWSFFVGLQFYSLFTQKNRNAESLYPLIEVSSEVGKI